MIWRVEWSYPALAGLRAIPWRQGQRVDAAVQRLAATNEGRLYRAGPHPLGARLYVSPYVVYLTMHKDTGVIWVRYVARRG